MTDAETWAEMKMAIAHLESLMREQQAALRAERDQALRERDEAREDRNTWRARYGGGPT